MKRPSPSASLDAVERALSKVAHDPLRAEAAALAVLSGPDVEGEAASVAHRTIGLAARETGRLSAARSRLRRAVAIAEAELLDVRAVEARLSLPLTLLQSGDSTAALDELDRAASQAPRELRGQVFLQRALMHLRLDRFEEALEDSRRALPLLRRSGDQLNEARLLSNRGILHAYRNELGLAEADLNKALRLYNSLGSEIPAAQVLHNLGYVASLRGDVLAVLRRYDQSAVPFRERGLAAPALSTDREQLLLSARLLPEARRQIEAGVHTLEVAGNPLDLAEARLLLSQIALAEGDLVATASAFGAARRGASSCARAGLDGRHWPDLSRHRLGGRPASPKPAYRRKPPHSRRSSKRMDGRWRVLSAVSSAPAPLLGPGTSKQRDHLWPASTGARVQVRRRSAFEAGTARR